MATMDRLDYSNKVLQKKSIKFLHDLKRLEAGSGQDNALLHKYLTMRWLELKLNRTATPWTPQALHKLSICPRCLGQSIDSAEAAAKRRHVVRSRRKLKRRYNGCIDRMLSTKRLVHVCTTCGYSHSVRLPSQLTPSTPTAAATAAVAVASSRTPASVAWNHLAATPRGIVGEGGAASTRDSSSIGRSGGGSSGKAKHNKTLSRVKLLQQRQFSSSAAASGVSSGGGMAAFLSLLSAGTPKR